jgi:hypothetical protein
MKRHCHPAVPFFAAGDVAEDIKKRADFLGPLGVLGISLSSRSP